MLWNALNNSAFSVYHNHTVYPGTVYYTVQPHN